MKMKAYQPLLLAIFAITVFASCKKNEDAVVVSENRLELITQKAWRVESISVDLGKDGTIDNTIPQLGCETDNLYTFNPDGTGKMDEGELKCEATDPQSSLFTWALISDDKMVSGNIPSLGFAGDATIKTLNNNTLEFYTDNDISGGATIRTIIKLKH